MSDVVLSSSSLFVLKLVERMLGAKYGSLAEVRDMSFHKTKWTYPEHRGGEMHHFHINGNFVSSEGCMKFHTMLMMIVYPDDAEAPLKVAPRLRQFIQVGVESTDLDKGGEQYSVVWPVPDRPDLCELRYD